MPEFSEDIRRFLTGLPVTATADTNFYRFSKFVGRNKIGTAIATVILLLSGIAIWQSIVANRERAKAETHVAQVREVAKTLLGETSQTLNNLPNSLEVRQTIIEKSATTLDSLSADIDDAEFLSELGTAYHQLGWTQIWHLRDFEKASVNLQKSRKLNEKAVELEPDNPKYLFKLAGTMGSLLEFYQQQGNTEAVVETYQTIIKINLRRIELEPNNAVIYFDNSNFYSDLSDALGGTAESLEAGKQSFEMIERAVELQQAKEQTPDVQSQLAFFLMGKGSLLEKSDKKDEALIVYQQAAETADQAYAADNTQMLGFNHSVRLRNMMAEIYRGRGDWQKVLELQQFCLNRLLQNKENKHLDQKGLPNGIAAYTMRVGITQDKLGKKEAGHENVEKGLNLYLENLKKFDNLAADILSAPGFFILATDYYVANNQKRKAADLWQRELINRVEIILQKTPNDTGMLNLLVDGFWRKGDALGGFQTDKNSFSESNAALLKESLENYQKSLAQVQKILLLDKSALGSKQIGENVERRISLLREKLARLGT